MFTKHVRNEQIKHILNDKRFESIRQMGSKHCTGLFHHEVELQTVVMHITEVTIDIFSKHAEIQLKQNNTRCSNSSAVNFGLLSRLLSILTDQISLDPTCNSTESSFTVISVSSF